MGGKRSIKDITGIKKYIKNLIILFLGQRLRIRSINITE